MFSKNGKRKKRDDLSVRDLRGFYLQKKNLLTEKTNPDELPQDYLWSRWMALAIMIGTIIFLICTL